MQSWIEALGLLEMNELTVAVRILLSVLCGGALGLERTRKLRPAGLRTYMLVSLGACIVMMTGIYLFQYLGPGFDPARMAAQVVSGIGFIGAGTIMVTRYYRVKGLTTAAGLWVSAAMGLAIGVGFYLGAVITCLAILLIMIFADALETRYTRSLRRMHIYLVLDDANHLPRLLRLIREKDIAVSELETTSSDISQGVGLFCTLKLPAHRDHAETAAMIEDLESVLFLEEIEG